MPCFFPPRMLQPGASFYRILSVASDAPVCGTWFTPGRSILGASAVLHSAPDAPIRGVFLSYSLRCLGCSRPWHRVLPRTIQSGGLGRSPLHPGCFNPGRLFDVFSPLLRTLQSVAPGSPPDDPVPMLGPSSTPPWMLQSGASCILLSSLSSAHQPHSARSCELALRAVGAAQGHPGGAPLAWVWGVLVRRSPTPDHSSIRACGQRPLPAGHGCGVRAWGPDCPWHLVPCRGSSCVVRASRVRGSRWPLWLGTCPCAVVLAGGVHLWRASCLALVRRSSPRPVALGALVGFPVAVVPSPAPGAVAPGFTGWLRGARGGRLRTGLIVPAAGPCRGRSAGRAPRRTRSGPRDWVVHGGSLRLWSWAACAAVVRRVWTRSLTPPVSSTVRLSTGDSAGARGPFRVDADPAPIGSEDATPGSRACVRACSSWPGWEGRPLGRALARLTFPLAVLGALFACSAPSGQGLPRLWLLLGFSFSFSFSSPPSPPLLRPPCVLLCVFPGPACLRPWRLVAPLPPLSPPPSVRPVVSCFSCFPAAGAWGLALLLPPPPSPRFFLFFAPPPLLSLAFPALRLPWAFAPAPFFLFFFPFLFFFLPVVRSGAGASSMLFLSFLSVRWLVLCCVGCWAWLSCAVSQWVLVSCFGGAVLVWPRRSPPCGSAWCVLVFRCPVLCSVALCCRVVVCCRAPPFVCVVACACCLFLAAARLLCVFWGVVLCVPCPLRPVRCCAALCWCHFVVLCASSVLFLMAGVVGSRCRCLLLGVCWWLWLPGVVVWWCVSALVPVSGLAVARRLPCCVLLPCAVSCGALLPCGSVLGSPVFFFCFSPCRWRCAGVPASLLSVRCSLALAGLAGVLCCCLLCFCVCCWARLSSVVS